MRNSRVHIWHYIKNYKFNSIFIKNFLFIIIPTIIPLIFISFSMHNYYTSNINEEIKNANANGLLKIKNMVDKTALECDRLSTWLTADNDLKLLLSYNDIAIRDYHIYEKFQNLYKVMGIISATNDYIHSAYIYLQKSDFVLSSDGNSMEAERFSDIGWLSGYKDRKDGESYWVVPRNVNRPFTNEKQSFISSFRIVSNLSEEGAVIINMDIQKIKKMIDNVNDNKEHDLIITDGDDLVLYNTDSSIIGRSLNALEKYGYLPVDNSSFLTDQPDNQQKVVTIQNSDYNNWKYIYITPVSQYESSRLEFYRFMVFSIGICIVISIIISFLISLKVFQPIKNMVSLLDQPEEWEGIVKIDDKKHFDEFKYVARSILNSMDRTRQMEETLEERMNLLKRAQTVALQAQINPHFLFNTLETINWKAMSLTKGENDVSSMLAALSQLLILGLDTENNLITIDMEIEHAKQYLFIQNMRYRDRIQVIWDIDPRILHCKIIKLTIQPLLENSIYHGIKIKKGKGTITISGSIRESKVVIEIADDGAGMDENEVEKMNMSMKERYIHEGSHIGVRNVNQRIKLLFGEEYGLHIRSEYGKGTIVSISIPVVE